MTTPIDERDFEREDKSTPEHFCWDEAIPCPSLDGPLGHGWKCGICGKRLHVG